MDLGKIRALIIDDEQKSRNLLKTVVEKYCPQVTIVGSAASAAEAYAQVQDKKPNLLFLDIEMPYGSGFDLLQRLNQTDFEVIFITAFDQYALQAIKFHALDYLLKPLDVLQLIDAVKTAEKRLGNKLDQKRLQHLLANLNNSDKTSHQLAIPTVDGREFIPINQIIHCAADGSYTSFALNNKKPLLSSKNLGEYEKILPKITASPKHCFFRVHHSHLINLSYIKKYNSKENYIQMEDESMITIAHRRKADFLKVLKQMNLY